MRRTASRSKEQEKQLEKLSEFKVELENFRNEVRTIAKFWRPNLNDGVQITAAPLWRLFRNKSWQKTLKETWQNLEDGEYDWAHLAYSTWPERVLKKCRLDRSLAFAHNVESEFWHEVEKKKGGKAQSNMEWLPKPFSEAEVNTHIRAIITDRIQSHGGPT